MGTHPRQYYVVVARFVFLKTCLWFNRVAPLIDRPSEKKFSDGLSCFGKHTGSASAFAQQDAAFDMVGAGELVEQGKADGVVAALQDR